MENDINDAIECSALTWFLKTMGSFIFFLFISAGICVLLIVTGINFGEHTNKAQELTMSLLPIFFYGNAVSFFIHAIAAFAGVVEKKGMGRGEATLAAIPYFAVCIAVLYFAIPEARTFMDSQEKIHEQSEFSENRMRYMLDHPEEFRREERDEQRRIEFEERHRFISQTDMQREMVRFSFALQRRLQLTAIPKDYEKSVGKYVIYATPKSWLNGMYLLEVRPKYVLERRAKHIFSHQSNFDDMYRPISYVDRRQKAKGPDVDLLVSESIQKQILKKIK